MRTVTLSGLVLLLLSSLAAAAGEVPATQARPFLRHLLPLPHEIHFEGFVTVRPEEVAVRLREGAGEVEQAAAQLVSAAVGQAAPPAGKPRLQVLLGVLDAAGKLGGVKVPGAEKLSRCPNRDQAYAMAPLPPDKLALTGLTEQGVYYAAVTLGQLLETKRTAASVTVPQVRVLDWPDLSERGGWGGNMGSDVEWMSARKLNLAEVQASLKVNDDGSGTAAFKPELVEEGRRHAFRIVPIIPHVEQFGPLGLFTRLPEVRGVGPKAKLAGHPYCEVACSFQPRYRALLANWMTDLAKVKGVDTICVWLSENDLQCGCEQCLKIGEFAAETRAIVAAWRLAQQVNPALKLRLLLTQGSYKTNASVLAEAPREVQISYYDGGRTYDSSRDPMIYPLLEDFARSGRWLGVYPQVTASWRIVCPWSGPQFMKYRLTEFVDKKLSNLCAYATPHNRLYDFNMNAAAEWSWNAHGRDEREFAAAWATRRGVKEPEVAADWAVLLGPVSWDVYGSGVPYPQFFGPAASMIEHRSAPVLGKGMFRYFPDRKHLQDDQAVCERATKLAERLGDPWISAETQTVAGYLTMLARLYDIAALISRTTPPTEAERRTLGGDLMALALAEAQVNEGLGAWEAASLETKVGGRLSDTRDVNDQTLAKVCEALRPFGVRNPLAPYLSREIGQYHTDDFEQSTAIHRVLEVTGAVAGAGTYQVRFTHTEGYNGATVQRVAIASAPKDHPEQLTELASDKHYGSIGYTPKDPVYTLVLPAYDEALGYYVVADYTGVKSSERPMERRGCNGTICMWKQRQAGEKLEEPPLLPMAEAEMARYGGPKFTRGVLRVGVLGGCYGAESLRGTLSALPDVEAQPLYLISDKYLKACQVVVVGQPLQGGALAPEAAALLAAFVRGGGGLVTTHNAVGFRGLPVILPEVCAGGLVNFRDNLFKVLADHPVAQGLAQGKPLQESYYDYITLKPGPAGTVVARGNATGEPVVVCGPAGKGRYVACGLGLGISPVNDADCPLTADEALLAANAVRWAAGK